MNGVSERSEHSATKPFQVSELNVVRASKRSELPSGSLQTRSTHIETGPNSNPDLIVTRIMITGEFT